MLAQQRLEDNVVVIADRTLLEHRARALGLPWTSLPPDAIDQPHQPGALPVMHVALAAPVETGVINSANAAYVLRTLEVAADGCMNGSYAAMATAPVHKGVINDAGIAFTGHTEFLAQRCGDVHVVMMLVGGGLRVALATTHVSVKNIAANITTASLEQTLRVLNHDLITRFGLATPRIAVAGLNPHAGESGHLGREEIEIMIPLLNRLREGGMHLSGPLPADTLFTPDRLSQFDCVLTMYHDQGLPVLKYASFGRGVNVTLGLPIVRTSVDHGTALDIAGSGKADGGSLREAITLATALARGHG